MNFLDYFIIGFIIFYSLWGLAKGFLKIILGLLGYVVALIAAKLLSPFLVTYVNGTAFYGNIHSRLFESFSKVSPELSRSIETLTLPNSLSELLRQEPALAKVFEDFPKITELLEKHISDFSGIGFMEVITEYLIMIICVVVIFVVTKIIFSIIIYVILSRRDDLPLAIFDRFLGLLIGLFTSLILLSFGLQLVEIFSLSSSPVLAETIANSQLGHYFTMLPIVELISSFIKK